MKKIHLVLVMMLASSSLFSQIPKSILVSTSLVTNNIRKVNYQFQTTDSRGQNLQYGGAALAAGGTCLMLAGIAMIIEADGETSYNYSSTNNGTYEEGSLEGGLGAVMVAGGAVMSAGGIVMIYFGSKRIKREKARSNLSFSPTKLTYRF